MEIAAVLGGDSDAHLPRAAAVLPVLDRLGDQLLIRDDRGNVVDRQHGRGSSADFDHAAFDAADLDPVAELTRTLEHHDQAADEIAYDVLEPEAHADADCPGDDIERRQIDPRGLHDHQKADDERRIAD